MSTLLLLFLIKLIHSRLTLCSLLSNETSFLLLEAAAWQEWLGWLDLGGGRAGEHPASKILLSLTVFKLLFVRLWRLLLVGSSQLRQGCLLG